MIRPIMSHNGRELMDISLLSQLIIHSPFARYIVQTAHSSKSIRVIRTRHKLSYVEAPYPP